MRQNTFGGRALPGPTGELKHSPDPLAAMTNLLLREEGREGEEGKEGRGWEGSLHLNKAASCLTALLALSSNDIIFWSRVQFSFVATCQFNPFITRPFGLKGSQTLAPYVTLCAEGLSGCQRFEVQNASVVYIMYYWMMDDSYSF